MKKLLFAAILLFLISHVSLGQETKTRFFYESISNSSKTKNFVIGVYIDTYNWNSTTNSGKGNATMKMAIINNASQSYDWNDYKVIIQLSDGKTFHNYKTAAKDGDYACIYSVPGNDKHFQLLCYDRQFSVNDIDKIFLLVGDDVFELVKNF